MPSSDFTPVRSHELSNLGTPLGSTNLFDRNPSLREAVEREGAGWALKDLSERGAELGTVEMQEVGIAANKFVPQLKLFDRYGRRCDEVEFHPAYHQLMTYLKTHGIDTAPWVAPKPGAHVARAAHFFMYSSVDNGTQCPMTMTYGAVPVLARDAVLSKTVLPKVMSKQYDQRFLPLDQKRGATIGMGMTEKQGGSDVRSNSSRSELTQDGYRLTGHKYFFSAPMCDGFFVTANDKDALSCFFVPRFTPDGQPNELRIQRLKDKLGDRSNASSEVEFIGAWATRVGAEGRGIPTILEMGNYTRLDCALGTAGLMRFALTEALHHTSVRSAFGKRLVEQPMMMNALADVAVEVEAHTALVMRLARSFDVQNDEYEGLFRRVMTPATKFWVCRRGPAIAAECMEMLGGIGYVEETVMPRIYRQMPLNSIWEGSGNVMCLDVLRALGKDRKAIEVISAELSKGLGKSAAYDHYVNELSQLFKANDLEGQARVLTQHLATAMEACLLLCHAPAEVAEAYCASRLGAERGDILGTLPSKTAFRSIIARAMPQ